MIKRHKGIKIATESRRISFQISEMQLRSILRNFDEERSIERVKIKIVWSGDGKD